MSNPRAIKYRRLALAEPIRKKRGCCIALQKPNKVSLLPPTGADRRLYQLRCPWKPAGCEPAALPRRLHTLLDTAGALKREQK